MMLKNKTMKVRCTHLFTARQMYVLCLMTLGITRKLMAEAIECSVGTVDIEIGVINRTFGVNCREAAVTKAFELRIFVRDDE